MFQVIGYSDTDVAEYIYKSKPDLVSLVNHLCKDLTDACSKKPPPVPKVPFIETEMWILGDLGPLMFLCCCCGDDILMKR